VPKSDGGWKTIAKGECPHGGELKNEATSNKEKCDACGLTEDLRICLTCGYVGCCESHQAHNTAHFKSSGHAFIRPHHAPGGWLWCYKCNAFLE